MFRGTVNLALDVKGRLAIPSRHRDKLIALDEGRLVLTVSPYDTCLWLYPISEWEAVEAKLKTLSDALQVNRMTKRMMFKNATDTEMDGQGRILIPAELRKHAELEKQVSFMGIGNKFEIWDEAKLEEMSNEWRLNISQSEGKASELLQDLSL